MSIVISDKPSLLKSLLTQELQSASANQPDGATGTNFSGRLDAAIAGTATEATTEAGRAQALAEALHLQMLHSTLALAGDEAAGAPQQFVLASPPPSVQALAKAYGQPEPTLESAPEVSVNRQPLPEVSSPIPAAAPEMSRGGDWLDGIIAKAAGQYGVDSSLIKAVIKVESNFKPTAVSRAGAQGLMQLMPSTARSLGVSDPFDPEQNVMAGTRFLRDLLKRYNGNLDASLAAYNWGPGNVDKRPDRMPRETQEYLARVKQLYASYSA